MVTESAAHAHQHASAPGTVVKNWELLWRVDGQEEDVLIATAETHSEREEYEAQAQELDTLDARIEQVCNRLRQMLGGIPHLRSTDTRTGKMDASSANAA